MMLNLIRTASVSGETNLNQLIQGMQPVLQQGKYVFCSVSSDQVPLQVNPICIFQEAEGTTLILTQQQADALGLSYDFVAAWITLTIHSSLEAVGLTAAIAQALAAEQISCNVVAAYYHDHIFVNIEDAQRAMAVLTTLSHQGQ